jgi:hypothetical protein
MNSKPKFVIKIGTIELGILNLNNLIKNLNKRLKPKIEDYLF